MNQYSRIYLSAPHIGEQEFQYVTQAFEQNWIAPVGPQINAFEEALANYFGVNHAVALTSGTAAMHLGLINLGVEVGDYVLCQSITFVATANPITYLGANPVFIDSEADTWNLDPEQVEEAIQYCREQGGKTPKALITVDLYGMPAKHDELEQVAERYGIPVIEDAAEAAGSTYQGRPCGQRGAMAVLSFNGNKIITTSGGGALITNNKAYADHARFLATQAKDPAPHYQHSHIGYNYRMSNVSAAIGIGQLAVLDDRVAQRRANFDWYRQLLGPSEQFTFIEEPKGCHSNRWLTTVLLKEGGTLTPETIRQHLESYNIESRPLWKPLHMQPVFQDNWFFGDGYCESLFNKGLCLPSGTNMTEEQQDRIAKALRELCHG
jgi:dTDP-4-amino-4,6-dideoxygalactose transaminase